MNSTPYCLTNFLVLDDYYIRRFDSFEDLKHIKERGYYPPKEEHCDIYGALKGKQENEVVDPTGEMGYLFVSESAYRDFLKTKKARSYNPLTDTKELYLELNKIELFDESSLLKFVQNYGIPSEISSVEDWMEYYKEDLNNEILIFEMDILHFYQIELKPFKQCIRLWNMIKDHDTQGLKDIRNIFEQEALRDLQLEKLVFADQYFRANGTEIQDWSSFIFPQLYKDWENVMFSSLETIGKQYLMSILRQHKRGLQDFHLVNGDISPAIKFSSLVEVAFWQLTQAILDDIPLSNCDYCHYPFQPLHGLQRFCSPLPGRKRSTCENSFNMRLKRQRKKQIESEQMKMENTKDK